MFKTRCRRVYRGGFDSAFPFSGATDERVPLVARMAGRASLQSLFSQNPGGKLIKVRDSCTRLPFPEAESRSRLVPATTGLAFHLPKYALLGVASH